MKLLRCIIFMACISALTIQIRLVATATRQEMQTFRGNIQLLLATEQYQAARQILTNDAQKGSKRVLPLSEYNKLMAQTLTNIRKKDMQLAQTNQKLIADYKAYYTAANNTFKTAQLGEFSTQNIDTVTKWFTQTYNTYQKGDMPAQTITKLKKNIITRITDEQNLAKKVEQLTQKKQQLTQKLFTALLNDTAAYTHRLAYLHILPKIIPDVQQKYGINFTATALTNQETYIKNNAIKLITNKITDLTKLQELFTDIKKFTTPERVQEVIAATQKKLNKVTQLITDQESKLRDIALIIPETDLSKNSKQKLQPISKLLTEWHTLYKTTTFAKLAAAINERLARFKTKKANFEDNKITALKEQQTQDTKLQPIIDSWNRTKAQLYADQLTFLTYLQRDKAFNTFKTYTQALAVPKLTPTNNTFVFDPTQRKASFIDSKLDIQKLPEIAQIIKNQ